MRLKKRFLPVGAAILAVSLIASCSGTNEPKAEPSLGAPTGVSGPSVTPSPSDTPTAEASFLPVPEDVEGDEEYVEADPRDVEYILGWKVSDLTPESEHEEVFAKEAAETVFIDTLLLLEDLSSYREFQNNGIHEDQIDLVLSGLNERMLPKALTKLDKSINEETAAGMFLLPHRIDGTRGDGKEVKFDNAKMWNISYRDLTTVGIEPAKTASDNDQAVFSIVQVMSIPTTSGEPFILSSKLTLYMEYGYDSWMLADWYAEYLSSEWGAK